jgi:hypothetical protein
MALFRKTPPPVSPPGGPEAGIPGKATVKPSADGGRAAPEPLSILLPAVAALGAVSSIAAVAWLAEERTGERPRVKRRVDAILKDLETSCLGIAEILRRVIRLSPMFGLLGPTSGAPLKFGLLGTRVEPAQAQTYVLLVNDVATMLVLATQASFDMTSAIEDGDLEPPEELLHKFGAAQEKLSGLLSSRPSLKTTAETALAVAEGLVAAVRALKQHKSALGGG